MGLVLVRDAENEMLHGPLRKGSRAAGYLPLVYVKKIFSVHSQTTKEVRAERSGANLTVL
jgi:hypothetical protein